MSTILSRKERHPHKSRRRPRPTETVPVEVDLVHDVLDALDEVIRTGDESPRLDSRGRTVWDDECTYDIGDLFAIENRLKAVLAKFTLERAVAKELTARGIQPTSLMGLVGGRAGGR